jgi:hypothetical protein
MTFFNEPEKFDYFIYEMSLSIQTKTVKNIHPVPLNGSWRYKISQSALLALFQPKQFTLSIFNCEQL